MILMTQKVGDGPTQRCDARCYNAKGGKCDCICTGRNHGAGIQKALENVREMFAPIVLCEHGKFFGYCEHGCSKMKTPESDIHIPRRTIRELKRQEQMHA